MSLTRTASSKQAAQQFLRRLANARSMDKLRMVENRRGEARVDFCVGVWVIPIARNLPDLGGVFPALTRDLSSSGLGIVANRSLLREQFFLCFPSRSEMRFLRAEVESQRDVGAGWYLVGLAVTELVDIEHHPRLIQFAASLLL